MPGTPTNRLGLPTIADTDLINTYPSVWNAAAALLDAKTATVDEGGIVTAFPASPTVGQRILFNPQWAGQALLWEFVWTGAVWMFMGGLPGRAENTATQVVPSFGWASALASTVVPILGKNVRYRYECGSLALCSDISNQQLTLRSCSNSSNQPTDATFASDLRVDDDGSSADRGGTLYGSRQVDVAAGASIDSRLWCFSSRSQGRFDQIFQSWTPMYAY